MFLLCSRRTLRSKFMNWARAIEINHSALSRIVAALVAMLELAGKSAAERLPLPLYRAVVRVLYPAESAVRRLIVIAARGVVVKVPISRPLPKGLVIVPSDAVGQAGGRMSFRLFDIRASFAEFTPVKVSRFRVLSLGDPHLIPLFHPRPCQPRPVKRAAPAPDGMVSAFRLHRRLAAIKLALDDLPRQALRMARWSVRRTRIDPPVFLRPIRPGPPPGGRKKPRHEIDFVLKECHALAHYALKQDTS
jgi:hypothetical protein